MYSVKIQNYENSSKAKVFSEAKLLAEIERNHPHFWYLLVENHPVTGSDYLLCGEDYQGLTVINLTRNERRNHLPPEAESGVAFCIVGATFDRKTKMLLFDGCYWAHPFEFRVYDFSNPDDENFGRNGLPDVSPQDTLWSYEEETEVKFTEEGYVYSKRFEFVSKVTKETEREVYRHLGKFTGDREMFKAERQKYFGPSDHPDKKRYKDDFWHKNLIEDVVYEYDAEFSRFVRKSG